MLLPLSVALAAPAPFTPTESAWRPRAAFISPDARTVVTAGGTYEVWDRKTGARTHEVGRADVAAVAFAKDGRIALATPAGVRVLGTDLVRPVTGVLSLGFDPDDGAVVAVTADSVLRWERGSTEVQINAVQGFDAVVGGGDVFAFTDAGVVRIDADSGDASALGGPASTAFRSSLSVGAAGQRIAALGPESAVGLYDAEAEVWRTLEWPERAVYAANLDVTGNWLAVVLDGEIELWTWKGERIAAVDAAAFPPTVASDGTMALPTPYEGVVLHGPRGGAGTVAAPAVTTWQAIASPTHLLTAGHVVALWDVAEQRVLRHEHVHPSNRPELALTAKTAAWRWWREVGMLSEEGIERVDLASGAKTSKTPEGGGFALQLDGDELVWLDHDGLHRGARNPSAVTDKPIFLRVVGPDDYVLGGWNRVARVTGGEEVWSAPVACTEGFVAVDRIACLKRKGGVVWLSLDGVVTSREPGVRSVAVSPDGKTVAAWTPGTLTLRSASGPTERTLAVPELETPGLAFTPSGRHVIVAHGTLDLLGLDGALVLRIDAVNDRMLLRDDLGHWWHPDPPRTLGLPKKMRDEGLVGRLRESLRE